MLPTFHVVRVPTRKAWAKVTCIKCHHWFIVHYAKWISASPYKSRPCPNCFKTSWIPTKDNK